MERGSAAVAQRAGRALRRPHNWLQLAQFCTVGATGYAVNLVVFAALVRALDVSRPDVIMEVAARAGVDLARFVPAFEAPATERALLAEIGEAEEQGIEASPSLVIGDDWMVTGARPLRDYRVILKRYLAVRAGTPVAHTVH
jgi:predicted DsbA family dithiol-disulfide isomerase